MSSTDQPACRDDLGALSRALLAVTEQTSTREVLQMIVESARSLVGSEFAALGVPDEQGRFAEFYAAGVSDEQWRAIGPVPRAHGLLSLMMREDRAYRTRDVQTDSRFSGWPSAHPDMRGFLGVPIVDCGTILGSVYVANGPDGGDFTAEDERLLGILAAHAAIALTRARMFERDRELTLVEERSRIARDLHDAVAQKLFSLRLTVGAAEALALKGDHERAHVEFTSVKELAGAALDELRAVVTELRPPAVREDGLVPALRKHVAVISRAHPVDVRFRSDCDGRCALPEAVEDAVFRVAQEALHNALQHGQPAVVDISLSTPRGKVRLTVSDDGRGFDEAPAVEGGHHLGLASMRERARRAGGRLRVESRPGVGTTVELEVPVE
ncbi:GAF domain-containing sensor histidine kinase [Actinopolymorpha alba]|uniref:GAF domain-containing sensor histidine kinase n=1 Tax=Actinopolymorpha alba TaxID=533267 RepID=UPI000378FEE0|nr:GAF domain-containing sensor histidine kinase [Actinopolymorpha alba]